MTYHTLEETTTIVQSNSVHLIFHMGNMICIDTILSEYVVLLITDVMNQSERSGKNWKERIMKIEEEIRNMYRKAFTSSKR